jgi:DNA-binding HxlR family transcriptional regulator
MERLTRDAVIAALRAVGTEHEHEWLTERGKQAHKVVEKLADWLEGDAKKETPDDAA